MTGVATPATTSEALLVARGVCKSFPGVQALDHVDLTLQPGEVHALLGENGAGKSTLIKVLTGAERRDSGRVTLGGVELDARSVGEAQRAGIAAVYQEVNLLPNLTVAENVWLRRQPTRLGLIRRAEMERRSRTLLAEFGLDIDVSRRLSDYSVAVRQIVAIARAVDLSAQVLVLDEPTASLDQQEVERLFDVLRRLKARGMAVVFITHFLDQVFAVSDRITVLRNGKLVGEREAAGLSRLELVSMMLGKELSGELQREHRGAEPGPPVAEFRGVGRRRTVSPFALELRAGEVVGAAGLLGSGRTETAEVMFGVKPADSGETLVGGRTVRIRSPRDAVREGFGYSPEERKTEGIFAGLSVRENIVLALQARQGWTRRLSLGRQQELATKFARALDIRAADLDAPIERLSGGNQQKALLARWLATEPRLLILDEPTRGVDVGAHAEIVRLIEQLCAEGMALYVISSEIEEVAAYADRVSVMRDRRQVAMLERERISVDAIVTAIAAPEPAVPS